MILVETYSRQVCLTILAICAVSACAQTPANDPHWQLVWSDDFNQFDGTRWVKAVDSYHGLYEAQLYRPENVSITENGWLDIEMIPELEICPFNSQYNYVGGESCEEGKLYPMSSGWIETREEYNIQYGYVEARISAPRKLYHWSYSLDRWYESWPAFWTFVGQNVPDVMNACEIDIFEMYGKSLHANLAGTNVHYCYCPSEQQPGNPLVCCPSQNRPSDVEIGVYDDVFITYAVQWDPDKIIWYYDGYPVRILPNHGFTHPVRVILNLASRWTDGGGINMSNVIFDRNMYFLPPVVDFPAPPTPIHMYVDYVKLFKAESSCSEILHSNHYEVNSNTNQVVNYVSLGNGGEWPSDLGETFLRGSNFVEITRDYTFPLGSDVYLEAIRVCDEDLSGACNERYQGCSLSDASLSSSVKRSVKIAGQSCSISPGVPSILIRAEEMIELYSTTEIVPSSGGSVTFQIEPCE